MALKIKNLALMLIVLVSCSEREAIDINNSDLVGTWNWVSTSKGVSGDLYTPQGASNNYKLTLNDNFTYRLVKNNQEIVKGDYKLVTKESISTKNKERFIVCLNSVNPNLEDIIVNGIITVNYENNHNLRIFDNNYDGIASVFKPGI